MTAFYTQKKFKKRVLVFFTAWFAAIQSMLPAVVLAEDSPAGTESAAQEQTFDPSPPPAEETDEPPAEPETPREELSADSSPSPLTSPDETIGTGDAYATSQSTTLVNTTLQDSTVEIVQGDLIHEDDVVIFTPAETEEHEATSSALPLPSDSSLEESIFTLDATNSAAATTSAAASATTGGNTQSTTGAAALATGDAVATAYATTVANTTLIDSTVEIALLTLLTEWDGDIILQPFTPEELEKLSEAAGHLYISNTGEVMTAAEAQAVTGKNIQISDGDATLVSGSASAVSSAVTVVNSTLIDAIIFDFFVQNWILWTGSVYNWSAPGSRETPSDIIGRHILSGSTGCSDCSADIMVENSATVTTSATAYASSGGNTQEASGSATMTTGNAAASAMAASMVNSTLINSSYRLLSLNLLAPWSGNLIFAYPDLAVSISAPSRVKAGTPVEYTVHVTNNGHRKDTGVSIRSGDELYILGDLAPFQSKNYTFIHMTEDGAETEVQLTAVAGGDLTEESLENNAASATVLLETEDTPPLEDDQVSHDIPALSLTASTNIATYIYAGDTARYEVTVTNNGPGTAYDTVFRNIFFDSEGNAVGTVQAPIGHMNHGDTKTVRFSLATSPQLSAGEYYTVSAVTGRSDDRTSLSSNQVMNSVPVRARLSLAPATVSAQEFITPITGSTDEGSIKGTATAACSTCRWAEILFAATTALVALYAISGRKMKSRRLSIMSIGWGLLGYTTLLLINAECVNGHTLVSGSFLCRNFLPLVLGESLILQGVLSFHSPSRLAPAEG